MAKKSTKKKKRSSKKKSSNNNITKIIIGIFVTIIIVFLAFKFIPTINFNKGQTTDTQLVKKSTEQNIKPKDEKPKEEIQVTKKEELQKSKEETQVSKKEELQKPKEEIKTTPTNKSSVAKSIEGCWMSTTGGAILTMKDFEYRIDFMGVDIGKPIVGTYLVEGEKITFSNKEEPCKGENGVYEVRFDKQEIGFKCTSDDCTKRKSTLTTEWEWLEE